MTKSVTKIQDKDTGKRLSVVRSTQDPTKYGIVILNPDGTPIQGGGGGGGNVKSFTLSSTSDLTTAQSAYNWYKDGKVAIIIYNDKLYFYSFSTTGNAYWCVANEDAYDTVSDTGLRKATLQLAVSSNTVTSITAMNININNFNVLRTGKDYGTPYTPEYNGSPATKKYVDDTASGKISDTAYGSGWDADTTHAPSKNAVYNKLNSMDTAIGTNTTDISTINGKIPSEATSSNQLADKDYVNDSINSITAYYITKDAQGDQFATYAELSSATTFYSGGVQRIPTRNDYCIVVADENHDNATTRYLYQNNQWEYQYTVNETALTTAQLNALNSGITSAKVSTYDGYATTISGKQDALTLPATPTQGNLVTWGADNKTLVDGGAVPTGLPSGGTDGQVLGKVSGNVGWVDPSGTDYSWVTKTISGGEVEIGLRTIVNIPTSDFTLTAPATLKEGEEYVIRVINEGGYTITLGTGFTNPRNVDLSLSFYATDQFVFLAIGGELELQPLVATGS